MLSILIFALIVLIVAWLATALIDTAPQHPPVNMIGKLVVLAVAIIAICDKAGLL